MEDRKKKIVFLLGSGFTKAITNNKAPSMKELGDQLSGLFTDEIKRK